MCPLARTSHAVLALAFKEVIMQITTPDKAEIASINGVALNTGDETLSADDLRQRACSELLRQAASAEGLLSDRDMPTTDGVLSDRLTKELAAGISRERPKWTVLVFPPISAGSSGSNEIGKQFSFPGTYALRPSTLRSAFSDLATELGDQGFRWILIVHVHGSPLHIGALDDAADYFHDTYGGTMVNLWGLMQVLGGWGSAMQGMTDAEKKSDGLSLHGGMDEHSLMLFLRPDLVAKDFREAKSVSGATYEEAFATARG